MAQTGFTPIQLFRTTTAAAAPTAGTLADGELAINLTDEKLYFKNAAGTVKLLAANITPVANGGTGVTTSTGTGSVVLSNSPTLVTPALGTPSSGTLTNATGLPLTTGVTGILPVANGGTATATPALVAGANVTITGTWPNQTIAAAAPGSGTVTAVSVVSANGLAGTSSGGATPALTLSTSITGVLKGNGTAISAATAGTDYVAPGGALGTPASGTLTNTTGLPISTGVSGLGTNVATFLGTPSSANLASAITDETGTGALVFATSPTLVTPALGTPASGDLTSCTADGTNAVGFRTIPQNSRSAAYTLVLADSGKHIFHPSADTTARTFTIPANSSVAYPIGTALTFINQNGAGVVTIAITTDTMRLSPAGTTGSRTLAANGSATCIKVTATEWLISGSGLT